MNPMVHHTVVLFEQQRLEEAANVIEQLLEMNPNDSAGHAILGLCHHLQGHRLEAVAHARQSLGLSPAMMGFARVTRALRRITGCSLALPSGTTLGVSGFGDFGDQGFELADGPVHFMASEEEIEALLDRWSKMLRPLLSRPKDASESRFMRAVRACSAGSAQKPISLPSPRQLPGRSSLPTQSAGGRSRFGSDGTDANWRYSHQ